MGILLGKVHDRSSEHEEIEGKGTDHEYTHLSCDGCPFNVEKFGEHKICGCILSTPDDWDEPKVIGYVVRTIIQEMAKEMSENEIREYALMNIQVVADRYVMAGIGIVVLRNNQTEQRGYNHRIFPLVLHREM